MTTNNIYSLRNNYVYSMPTNQLFSLNFTISNQSASGIKSEIRPLICQRTHYGNLERQKRFKSSSLPKGRQSLLSLHMTKSYVRTATRSTLKVEANLTQILNFKANFHTEFEPFFKKKIYANNGGHFKIVSIKIKK